MVYDWQTGSPVSELERGQKQPNRRLTRIAKLNNIMRDTDLCRAVDRLTIGDGQTISLRTKNGFYISRVRNMLREPDSPIRAGVLHDSVPSRH